MLALAMGDNFYYLISATLLAVTLGLAWHTRPSTTEVITEDFSKFKLGFLLVWAICVMADWLQGPYVYALYAAYGFKPAEIARLFVAGFGASLVFGCAVGPVADRFGRKKICLAYCAFYIVSCLTKHFNDYNILMFGRVTGGIATSMLFSGFESWLVAEHQRNNFSKSLLSYMLGMMYAVMYVVAIFSGIISQWAANMSSLTPLQNNSTIYYGGYLAPFDLSILCSLVGMCLIVPLWDDNFGALDESQHASMGKAMSDSLRLMFRDPRVVLLGIVCACFEGAMYAFVFNWTPALESKTMPPPHGLIFSAFMMSCMCGASTATIASNLMPPIPRLRAILFVGMLTFGVVVASAGLKNHLCICFSSFVIFEFCCGMYFPSVGVLKSDVVPDNVRSTVYNLYRVPLNGIVVALLLSDLSYVDCFRVCGVLLFIGMMSLAFISKAKADND